MHTNMRNRSEIGTAPQRDSKNQSSNRTLTSASQYEIRFFDVLRHKYCACHEKMRPKQTKSCNCDANCQHSRIKFDDNFTKRAFRADQNMTSRAPNNAPASYNEHFSRPPKKSNPCDDFAHRSKPSRFAHFIPHFRKPTRRAGENEPPKRTSPAPLFRADEMQFFDVQKQLFCEPAQ